MPARIALRELTPEERTVEEATAYWNKHRHPFVRGRRRRHRPRRRPGIAAVPGVGGLAG